MNAKERRQTCLVATARSELWDYRFTDTLSFTFRYNGIRYSCKKIGSNVYEIYTYNSGQFKARFIA